MSQTRCQSKVTIVRACWLLMLTRFSLAFLKLFETCAAIPVRKTGRKRLTRKENWTDTTLLARKVNFDISPLFISKNFDFFI